MATIFSRTGLVFLRRLMASPWCDLAFVSILLMRAILSTLLGR
jgi:hypothetical protein